MFQKVNARDDKLFVYCWSLNMIITSNNVARRKKYIENCKYPNYGGKIKNSFHVCWRIMNYDLLHFVAVCTIKLYFLGKASNMLLFLVYECCDMKF